MAEDWSTEALLLKEGIEETSLSISDQQQQQMIEYLKLLTKWNKAFNLTSITDRKEMVIKHLLDSLIALPWIKGTSVLDVGTGAGIPGVPLAIAKPELSFTVLDSNGKKTRFIKQAISELGIQNVQVAQARTENFHPESPFQQIICRAYSSLTKFVEQTGSMMHPSIELLAMKGQFPTSEIEELPNSVVVEDQIELSVPYLHEQRHLIILKPRDA